MRKLLIGIIFIQLVLISSAFAGGVTDNNDTHPGDILVGVSNNGSNSTGHWTDPSTLDSLRGPQGVKGDTGSQGPRGFTGAQGIQGFTGLQGMNGADGAVGPQGDLGIDGVNGIDGATGPQGDPGVDGSNGVDGASGVDGANGDKGDQGNKGDQGLQGLQGLQGIQGFNGKDVDPKEVKRLDDRIDSTNKRVSELEETQINIDGEVIFQRGRRHTIGAYGKYDMRHNRVPEVGIRVSIALEDSYEMKEIDKLNKKIDKMNKQAELSNIETETAVENGKIITRIKR
jgi:hypothetical protein